MKKQTYKLDIPIPANVKRIHNAFKREGFPLFLVGGAVRDTIMGIPPKDYDMATPAHPSDVLAIAEKYDLHVVDSLGQNHGVVIVDGEEIATFRVDIGKGRRPSAVEFTDMETDVKRRDLTINALYYDIDHKEVIDFIGGMKDIRNAKIRTVGQPTDRFDEDALRKLRAVRFSGRMGSKMDKSTYEAIKRDPSLPGVPGERIRDEFMKGIRTAKSSKSYILLCFELKLMPLILPSMKLRKPTSESKDPIVQIADMLRGNDINRVNKLLNSMEYSKRENAQVRFLLEFADFHIDKLTILKRAEERCGISKESLIEFGVIVKKRKESIKFANFKLSVRGGDAPDKLPKKNIGNWMQDAERQKYLNEVNMRKSELRRIIREEISQLNEGDVSSSIKWNPTIYAKLPKRMRAFLDSFPNDADSWRYATGEVADIAKTVLEYYNQYVLEVDSDDVNWVFTSKRMSFSNPGDFNKFYKSVISLYFNKLPKYPKAEVLNRYNGWF
jgi:tRNA nucleotidyltransferase/poly(A) polymerase